MLLDQIRSEILEALRSSLKDDLNTDELAALPLEIPPELKLGDFAFPTFRLAKALKKAPSMIAKELAEKIARVPAVADHCEILTLGPYLNFKVKHVVLTGKVLESLLLSGDALAEKNPKHRPNIVLEFSSPNVAKAFNIYHLRSTMIGNSLYRIFKARGFNPVAINHLGDWGTQYGTLALAFEKYGDQAELEKRGIPYLVELYVRINKEIEADPSLGDKARAYFARLEQGDAAIKKLWEKFVSLSIKEFERTYERLGVHFDHYWGESFYVPRIPALEKELTGKKLLVESDGAQVVMLDPFNMPPCLIRKRDGSTIYATRDLAAAIYRHGKFDFERMVYVVGAEQKLHFAQVFKTLELMGYDWAKRCMHVDFGLYKFVASEGTAQKMSTRQGRFVTLEAVLDEAVARVLEIMRARTADKTAGMSDVELGEAAEIIGTGAIVFNDLCTDRNGDVHFDLERVCDFEGETGPYIQYAHTRCLGIVRNAPPALAASGAEALWKAAQSRLQEPEELDLIRTLARLPLILDHVLETYRPSALAGFLIDITKQFNAFYRAHKVLVEDTELARARLALVLATQRTLQKGLTLLGMKTPERM